MFNQEPAVIFNGIAEVIRAVIPCLILFGVIAWSDEQIAAVMLVVSTVVGVLSTLLTRATVTPTRGDL